MWSEKTLNALNEYDWKHPPANDRWIQDWPACHADLLTLLRPANADDLTALRDALVAGRMDGGTYHGPCACIIGTIGNARYLAEHPNENLAQEPAPHSGWRAHIRATQEEFRANAARPAEGFAGRIRPGDTPATNPFSAALLEVVDLLLA